MFITTLFGRLLTIELFNGIGFFVEFSDSRPMWIFERDTTCARAFEGTIIMLPLLVITFGKIYGSVYHEL
jgi:hypothetical protein